MAGKHGCGCCSCLCGCLFSCLLSLIFQILFTILFIVGLAAFIFWLVFRPNEVKFQVTNATLTEFNFDANNMLRYDLALNISVRNPNKRIGIYYDRIEASGYYQGKRLKTETLTQFYQGHKNTTVLSPVFQGQQLVVLGTSEVSEYNTQTNDGVFSFVVKLNLKIRAKLGLIKIGSFKPKIKCDFKVPLSSNGTSAAAAFETTKCSFDL